MDTLHKNFFSTAQVADILEVNRVTVFRMIQDGTITATKVGRNYIISHEELLKHLDKHAITEPEKVIISKLVDKALHDYGETIRMLGRE